MKDLVGIGGVEDKWQANDPAVAQAVAKHSKWYSFMLTTASRSWMKRTEEKLDSVMNRSKDAIRKLNDQFVSPSGTNKSELEQENA